MSASPKISIVTPVYNGSEFLEKAIHSVLDQAYPNLEYVIVDGGSTDGTIDIIRSYSDKISYWISEPDKGMYDALNKGFGKCTGEIMAWLNADDMLHPNSLQCAAEIFSAFNQVDWITGVPTVFDAQGICRRIVPQRKWSLYNYLMGDYFTIQQESVMWRRSLWDKSGGQLDSRYKLAGDFELWMRFFRAGGCLYSTQSLIGGFRKHTEGRQLSGNGMAYRQEVSSIYKSLKLTENEKHNLQRIKRLNRISRWPVLRNLTHASAKLSEIYAYPPVVTYNAATGQYEMRPWNI